MESATAQQRASSRRRVSTKDEHPRKPELIKLPSSTRHSQVSKAMSVVLIGAGQVGCALERALRARGIAARLLPWRQGLPRSIGKPTLVLLCVRDSQISDVTQALRKLRLGSDTVVAHVSGAQGPEILDPLRATCGGVAQFHPFSSIRAFGHPRRFAGAYFLASGDASAVRVLRRMARQLGSILVPGEDVHRARYHLAAALLANGSIALLNAAARLLEASGVDAKHGVPMLLDLENSVINNAQRLGITAALTGPVRRGDLSTIRKHLDALEGAEAWVQHLYRSVVEAQIEMVRDLGEVDPDTLSTLQRLVTPSNAARRSPSLKRKPKATRRLA